MLDKEELDDLYQSLVLEHSKRPRNFGAIKCSCHTKGKNPSCGDEINIYLIIGKDNNVEEIKFDGQGCALSIASASLMTQTVKGKNVEDAKLIIDNFINFIKEDVSLEEKYEPLHIFGGVKNFPLRVKCVLLGWRAFEQALNNSQKIVSTE